MTAPVGLRLTITPDDKQAKADMHQIREALHTILTQLEAGATAGQSHMNSNVQPCKMKWAIDGDIDG